MAEEFTCQVEEKYRSACEGLAFYAEHEDKRYCVLHYPGREKKDDFEEVLRSRFAEPKDGIYDFGGTVFPEGTANFEGAEFDANVSFQGATFHGEADFSKGTTFNGKANFGGATFKSEADFSKGTIFEGEARFRKATFERDVDFSKAIFKGKASFRRTTFEGSVDFEEPKDSEQYSFNARVDFSMAIFEKRARFIERRLFNTNKESDTFLEGVTFRDALIERPGNFSLDRVHLRPSWFIDTNVQSFRFTHVLWQGLRDGPPGSAIEEEIKAINIRRNRSKEKEEDSQSSYGRDVLAKTCRELSANAEDNRDYDTANNFHYWSMECLRKEGLRRWGPIGTLYWLYWALNGYGERPLRAICVLFGMWTSFAILYMIVAGSIEHVGQAFLYSLAAIVRLTNIPAMADVTTLLQPSKPGLFQLLVTAEGILGPLQIALLALALRRQVMR